MKNFGSSKTYFWEFFKFSLYSVINFGSILSKSFFEWIPFSESFSRNSNSNLMDPISEYSMLFFGHLSFAFGWYWTYFVFLLWKSALKGSHLYYLIKMTNKSLLKTCYLIFPNHFFFWIIKLEFENLSRDINLRYTLIGVLTHAVLWYKVVNLNNTQHQMIITLLFNDQLNFINEYFTFWNT